MWLPRKLRSRKIANALRTGDLKSYQRARYPYIQEGEGVIFYNEDFSGVDFSFVSMGFFVFNTCNLTKSHGYNGVGIVINNSNARGVNLRGVHTVIEAHGSDFRGTVYDENTILASQDGASSTFEGCLFDPKTEDYFRKQGVVFR